MAETETSAISVKEQFSLEAKPDVALIKLYVTAEGMLMRDAVENMRKKMAEINDSLTGEHCQVERIDRFDVYLGQKEDRLSTESRTYPRPWIVQGILITARPDDERALHAIMDEGIKHGALLENPRCPSYVHDILDSALLFGLVGSEQQEREAFEQCLKRAEARCRALAIAAGKRVGRLIEVSEVSVRPSMGEPFHKDFMHIRQSFPTRFLSPTSENVVICATLTAKYEMLDGDDARGG